MSELLAEKEGDSGKFLFRRKILSRKKNWILRGRRVIPYSRKSSKRNKTLWHDQDRREKQVDRNDLEFWQQDTEEGDYYLDLLLDDLFDPDSMWDY
jgi:hypothetical protein